MSANLWLPHFLHAFSFFLAAPPYKTNASSELKVENLTYEKDGESYTQNLTFREW